MKTFAFIFARGGSKGLKKKNILKLGGLPLLAHSILLAKKIRQIDRVFVSSESREIIEIAEEYGAEIIIRPKELATDHSNEWLSWQHAIETLRNSGLKFDIFCSLPPTAPLRSESDVNKCINSFKQGGCDLVLTSTPSSRNPYFNMVSIDHDGFARVVIDGKDLNRRQDAPEVYDLATVAYVTNPEFIMNTHGIFEGNIKTINIPKQRAVDIDDKIDFLLAERLFNEKN